MDRRSFLKICGLVMAGAGLPKEHLTVADIRKCGDELEKNQYKYLSIGVDCAKGDDVATVALYGITQDGIAHLLKIQTCNMTENLVKWNHIGYWKPNVPG